MLLLFLHDDPTPHQAEVAQIAHDCDLALIRPKEPQVLNGTPPLELGGLPRLGSTVETLGYPAGGKGLSSTRGIVSRIEEQRYEHSGADRHLTVQTDAAVNPGNSGGPVIQDGRVVGVAFQARPGLESVGYFIPTEVVERFLKDVADGSYDGYPDLGLNAVDMHNPAARRAARMAEGETGALVDRIEPGASVEDLVQVGDVLLEVDGRTVANDGTVSDGDNRHDFGMLVDRHQVGDHISLRLLRDGERMNVEVALAPFPNAWRMRHAYDRFPHYYIHAGLVFVPLELETIKTFGPKWPAKADRALLDELLFRPLREPELLRKQRIVLLRRLDHPVNASIVWARNQVVERVNGRPIGSLEDLISAIEDNEADYHEIELATFRRFAVLDRRAALEAHKEILERYGIRKDRFP
jgi:S1-C subfamily serine protease